MRTGKVFIKIYRNKPRKTNSSGRLRVAFSPDFADLYRGLSEAVVAAYAAKPGIDLESLAFREMYDITGKISQGFASKLYGELEAENPGLLLFIPAGRAFFTSMGKAATAFEHAGVLDPITVRFGRQFSGVLDRRPSPSRIPSDRRDLRTARDRIALDLFGGVIKTQRDQNVIIAQDGRIIPFSIMSSGQQELLPLWQSVDYYLDQGVYGRVFVFIEEPEAHLFPSAQNQVIEYLCSFANVNNNYRMMLSTHSPYVLAKINNLIKGGSLGSTRPLAAEVEKVVPKHSWLKPGSVAAYCIKDGYVKSIMDESLIDAHYLDNVSSEISDEFSALLELEYLR